MRTFPLAYSISAAAASLRWCQVVWGDADHLHVRAGALHARTQRPLDEVVVLAQGLCVRDERKYLAAP